MTKIHSPKKKVMTILLQREKCYHAVSKRAVGMRVELAKKKTLAWRKKNKISEIHNINSLECIGLCIQNPQKSIRGKKSCEVGLKKK